MLQGVLTCKAFTRISGSLLRLKFFLPSNMKELEDTILSCYIQKRELLFSYPPSLNPSQRARSQAIKNICEFIEQISVSGCGRCRHALHGLEARHHLH